MKQKRNTSEQQNIALENEAEQAGHTEWQAVIPLCGSRARFESGKDANPRVYVITHTYVPEKAAKKLGLGLPTIHAALQAGDLTSFIDPAGVTRIPAEAVEAALEDPERREAIARHESLHIRHMALVSGLSYTMVREHLYRANLSTSAPTWEQVRGRWSLPETLAEYQSILAERLPLWQAGVDAAKRAASNDNGHSGNGYTRGGYSDAGYPGSGARISRSERKRLSQQLTAVFPTWESYDREDQRITLHLGPTNSGKTYQSIQQLIEAGSGWYLAPLRLLAHEVFDTLNKQGVACNLLTGEERKNVPGARITAATIEMFDPHRSGACVVIDEAHMLSDSQRGWAWTRAIMETRAPEVHIIGAPMVEPLVQSLADEAGFSITVESYERLTPLEVAPSPWSLATLPARTILVAFSRRTVLALKTDLERLHRRTVSVIYGNLPPEVRLRQAERFANGETEICVATDAIGMGLNLPADNVCFYETSKFDGVEVRQLNENEIRQIAGRAGRYGLSENGWVGALNKADLNVIRDAIQSDIADMEYARVAPSPESIALLPGQLYEKLEKWVSLAGIPPRWKEILKPMELSAQIELARQLGERDVARLGEEKALTLINAPSYKETQDYWLLCARAIIRGRAMPLPERPSPAIATAQDLEKHEIAIRSADIYLWLAQREGFGGSGPQVDAVRELRQQWALQVDAALRKKIDTARRCRDCGRSLQTGYAHNICERCYRDRRYNRYFN